MNTGGLLSPVNACIIIFTMHFWLSQEGSGGGVMVAVFKAAMKYRGIRWSKHQWESLQSLAGQTRAGWVTVTGRFNSLPLQSHCLPARFPFFLSRILSVSLMCPSFFFFSPPYRVSSCRAARLWTVLVYLFLIPLVTHSLSLTRQIIRIRALTLPIPSDADRPQWQSVGTRKWAPDR